MKSPFRLFLLFLSSALGVAAQTPQWEIFETSFTPAEKLANPFWDARIEATFTHGERRLRVDGFYDGDDPQGRAVYRVRFAPDLPGAWSWRIASNLKELDGKTGEMTATAPVSAGGLVRRPEFPKMFFRADGTAFTPVNYGIFPHPNDSGGADFGPKRTWGFPTEDEMNRFIDLIGTHGFNMLMDIRVLYQRQDRITDPSFYPPLQVVDAAKWKVDAQHFNLAYFQRLDRELARARRYGMFYTLQIMTSQTVQSGETTWAHSYLNAENGGWIRDRNGDGDGDDENEYYNADDPDHVRHLEALVRYTIARTGAAWNVMYRIDGDTRNSAGGRILPEAVAIRWLGHWRKFVAATDPYQRPVTLGRALETVTDAVGSDWNAVPDWAQSEMVALGGPALNWRKAPAADVLRAISLRGQFFWSSPDYTRPVILYESIPALWVRPDFLELERKAYWVALASGFSWARPDSHFELVVGQPGQLFEVGQFKVAGELPILTAASHLAQFLRDTPLPWERMAPMPALVKKASHDAFVRAVPGQSYCVVLPEGGAVVLPLPAGKGVAYEAQLFNPRDGSWREKTVGSGGENVSFDAPDGQDWVLVIQRKH